jgi:ABC-2 type transport system ATP-binding protein
VAFAQALDHWPDLLILDEPTSGVGPLASARLWEAVRAACEHGAGALVTTHNLEEAVQCDRLVVMASGAIVAEGTAESIVGGRRSVVVDAPEWSSAFEALRGAGLPATLVGRSLRVPGTPLGMVTAVLADNDVRLSVVPATLEEAFLGLVETGSRGDHAQSPAPSRPTGGSR